MRQYLRELQFYIITTKGKELVVEEKIAGSFGKKWSCQLLVYKAAGVAALHRERSQALGSCRSV